MRERSEKHYSINRGGAREELLKGRIEKLTKYCQTHRANMPSRQGRLTHFLRRADTAQKHRSRKPIAPKHSDNFSGESFSRD